MPTTNYDKAWGLLKTAVDACEVLGYLTAMETKGMHQVVSDEIENLEDEAKEAEETLLAPEIIPEVDF